MTESDGALLRGMKAILTKRYGAGRGLSLVTLEPPEELRRLYEVPGQYIEIQASTRGYFVLAGEVGAPSWQLLVRSQGGVSEELTEAHEGTAFEVSAPLGKGFPSANRHGQALILAVVGSALGAARPILRERLARRDGALPRLYLGVRSLSEIPLSDEINAWVRDGVRVVLCLSQEFGEPVMPDAMRLEHGYVQDVIARDFRNGRLGGACIFAAGPAGMMDALRALASDGSGVDVHTNA